MPESMAKNIEKRYQTCSKYYPKIRFRTWTHSNHRRESMHRWLNKVYCCSRADQKWAIDDSKKRTWNRDFRGGKTAEKAAINVIYHRKTCETLVAIQQEILHGLLVDGKVIREPIEQAKGLAAGWAPVFTAKTFLADAADEFLSEHARPYDFSSVQPPEHNDYRKYIA